VSIKVSFGCFKCTDVCCSVSIKVSFGCFKCTDVCCSVSKVSFGCFKCTDVCCSVSIKVSFGCFKCTDVCCSKSIKVSFGCFKCTDVCCSESIKVSLDVYSHFSDLFHDLPARHVLHLKHTPQLMTGNMSVTSHNELEVSWQRIGQTAKRRCDITGYQQF